jgi:hypothetical protein
MVTSDERKVRKVLDEVGEMVKGFSLDNPPPENGRLMYKKIAEITGNPDPFREIKRKYTDVALKLYPLLKQIVAKSSDKLLMAIKLAIAGNVIDFGAKSFLIKSPHEFDLEKEVQEVVERDFFLPDYEKFKESLLSSSDILYIGDNAGETVFDRVLIEELGRPVTYAVRGEPIINDATYEDAVRAGMDKVATILSSGVDAPGTILARCSDEFRKEYDSAELLISKGQGNYETLSGEERPIFYLLKVKCPVIAQEMGVEVGSMVLREAKWDLRM